jgi:hypothetical protein
MADGLFSDGKMIDGLLVEFTMAALHGAATTSATRHDCQPDKLAREAVRIAVAAIEELKKTGSGDGVVR